jgi:hypothetical protein
LATQGLRLSSHVFLFFSVLLGPNGIDPRFVPVQGQSGSEALSGRPARIPVGAGKHLVVETFGRYNEWVTSPGRLPIERKGQDRITELIPVVKQRLAASGMDSDADALTAAAEEEMRRLANYDCRWCGVCGRALAPDEPVWREHFDGSKVMMCSECHTDGKPVRSGPCHQCGRPLHDACWFPLHLCSARCRWKRANAARSARRAKNRAGRRCEQCGETLRDHRSDATFCSAACRRRAYRQRQALRRDDSLAAAQ